MKRYRKAQLIDVTVVAGLFLLPFIVTPLMGSSWHSIRAIGPYAPFEERTGTPVGHIQFSLIIFIAYAYYSYHSIKPTLKERYEKIVNDPNNCNKSIETIRTYHKRFFLIGTILCLVAGLGIVPALIHPDGRLSSPAHKLLFFGHFAIVVGISGVREFFWGGELNDNLRNIPRPTHNSRDQN